MKRLARLSIRRRWLVLLAWITLFVGLSAAASAAGSSYSDSFSLPGTDSTHAYALLAKGFPAHSGDSAQIVFHTTGTSFDDPKVMSSINELIAKVRTVPMVSSVLSPYCDNVANVCLGQRQISPVDHHIAFATVTFRVRSFSLPLDQIKAVESLGSTYRSAHLDVQFGGHAFEMLARPQGNPGEIFGIIAAALVLLLAFGSFFAMLLPLGVAMFSLTIASAATVLLSHTMNIAQFAPTLGSLIGLGVGIDYALFIVTRSRQGLKQGMSVDDAIMTAINTSGRAVLFAGSTVCVALLGMLVLRLSFLNGVAVGASITVAITMLASITLLPALLAFQKQHVLSRRERRRLSESGPQGRTVEGGWVRWSRYVARHPRSFSAGALVVMGSLTVPFFSLHLGNADAGSNPVGSTTRMAYDYLSTGFGPGTNGPLQIVAQAQSASDVATIDKLNRALRHVPHVVAVTPVEFNRTHSLGIINVIQDASPQSQVTSDLITKLRTSVIPSIVKGTGVKVYVGGATAVFDDFANVLQGKIPLFVGVIVLLGCLLLMIAFRSILVPLVAAAMNLLAAASSFGVVVAVFQWGWGSNLIGAGSGPIEAFLPVIMIAILFGLSMDYQVFLVSRMHEEWLRKNDNKEAVIRGQANTGGVITAAALIMICVFISFVFGGERVIAEFGIGLGSAVLLDAFILRTLLVPALMHLIGSANWWLPSWLERVLPHLAVEDHHEA